MLDTNTCTVPFDHLGETEPMDGTYVQCRLGFELLQPLLDTKITSAERMLLHFLVAETFIHEVAVGTLQTLTELNMTIWKVWKKIL